MLCSVLSQLVRIQVQIQETLIRQYSHHPAVKNAVSQLDSELMDITKVTQTEKLLWNVAKVYLLKYFTDANILLLPHHISSMSFVSS